MKPLQNDFVAANTNRAATMGEVMKLITGFRIPDASRRGRGLRLSAVEVRALDWAIIRDCTVPHAEDHWLVSDCETYVGGVRSHHI